MTPSSTPSAATAAGARPTHHTVGEPLLSVRDLKVHFPTDDGLVKSVDGLSYDLAQGGTIGIVGESGSGKSVSSQAIMGLHRGTRAQLSGEIIFDGKDLLSAAERVTRAHDHDASRSPLERGADAIRAAVASAREIVGNYLATPDPLVDRARDADSPLAAGLAELNPQVAVLAPLRARGRPLGVLYVDSAAAGARVTEDDTWLVLSLAEQASLAIDNARLYGLETRKREAAEAPGTPKPASSTSASPNSDSPSSASPKPVSQVR